MKIAIIDIESSGLPPKGWDYNKDYMSTPRILSIAWKIVKDGQESQTYEYFINQEGIKIPPEATKINGITDAHCDASKFNIFTVLLQFIMDLNDVDIIIGHNIYFDSSLIKGNTLRIISGGKTPMDMFNLLSKILHKDKRIDTMRAGQKLCGGKWPKLTELHYALFQENYDAHSSGNDVDACYRVFQELIRLNAIKIILPSKALDEVVKQVVCEEEI